MVLWVSFDISVSISDALSLSSTFIFFYIVWLLTIWAELFARFRETFLSLAPTAPQFLYEVHFPYLLFIAEQDSTDFACVLLFGYNLLIYFVEWMMFCFLGFWGFCCCTVYWCVFWESWLGRGESIWRDLGEEKIMIKLYFH